MFSTLICLLLIWRNVDLELSQSSELSEQQKVAIPGWLREDQKEGLHQEGHFALIKQPRSAITKEKEAKRRIPCCGGGGGGGVGSRWGPKPFSPHPGGDFWSGAFEFSGNLAGFGGKIRSRKIGGSHVTFPKTRQFINKSYVNDMFRIQYISDRYVASVHPYYRSNSCIFN
jgi:hypothetical protein